MKKLWIFLAGIMLLSSCAVKKEPYDYTAFKESKPKSILVVMPKNNSVDVKADNSVLARASYPLGELGYYVYPVALVDEVFKQNGLTDGNAIHSASLKKIQQIFGADAILYIIVNDYGTSYKVIDSVTTVSLDGKLVDVKTGKVLWEGEKRIAEGSNSSNQGVLGMLLSSVINQIIDTSRDKGYQIAAPTMNNLLYQGRNGGLLIGPKHPNYGKQ